MSYLELLKLASPEAIVIVTALVVLAVGLTKSNPTAICSFLAAAGLAIAAGTVLRLPAHANLFGGMLVISPLNSLFKVICLALAFVTIPLLPSEKSLRNPGEYLAMLLLATVGLLLLVGSEELLMIFIGLELLGLSLYVLAAFDKTDVRSVSARQQRGARRNARLVGAFLRRVCRFNDSYRFLDVSARHWAHTPSHVGSMRQLAADGRVHAAYRVTGPAWGIWQVEALSGT